MKKQARKEEKRRGVLLTEKMKKLGGRGMKKSLMVFFLAAAGMMLLASCAHQGQNTFGASSCTPPVLSPDKVTGPVTVTYAKVKDGNVVFGKSPTAYGPDTLNAILTAYGLTISADAVNGGKVPASYAKVKDGNIVFGKNATAYSPVEVNQILNAYNLTLPVENASGLVDPPNYVKVKDGNLVFGKNATAYSADEFNKLLSAYCLPAVAAFKPEEPKQPVPVEPGPVVEEHKEVPCTDSDRDGVCDDQDDCPDTPKGAYVNARGCWVIENLLFDYNKWDIKPKYYQDLNAVVEVLKNNPYLNIEIQGHTCTIGSKKFNQRLSERRAKSVMDYFLKKGISRERLTSVGYWFSRPAAPNDTEENRKLNRRVELHPLR